MSSHDATQRISYPTVEVMKNNSSKILDYIRSNFGIGAIPLPIYSHEGSLMFTTNCTFCFGSIIIVMFSIFGYQTLLDTGKIVDVHERTKIFESNFNYSHFYDVKRFKKHGLYSMELT